RIKHIARELNKVDALHGEASQPHSVVVSNQSMPGRLRESAPICPNSCPKLCPYFRISALRRAWTECYNQCDALNLMATRHSLGEFFMFMPRGLIGRYRRTAMGACCGFLSDRRGSLRHDRTTAEAIQYGSMRGCAAGAG